VFHFTSNSWNTPQDQINAGYPIYAQPSNTSASIYEQTIDLGAQIASALITLTDMPNWVAGNGTITRTISYSSDDVSYTDVVGVTQALGTSFRYVKVSYDIAGDDDTSIMRMPAVRVRLDVKTESDEVTVTSNSGDGSGTLVAFNKTFLDIKEDSIMVSVKGTTPRIVGHTITGNDVRVLLWDIAGVRVTGDVTVQVSGIIANP
jgi:hypothetical protein